VSLGQVKVSDKSNEITAIPKLLRALDLAGNVVTIDSIGCQRKIISKIDTNKTDFVIQVKENQRNLLRDIKTMFEWYDFSGVCPLSGTSSEHISEEKGHGRLEKRDCVALSGRIIKRVINWDKVKSIVRIVNFRKDLKTLERTEESHYYITSIEDDAGRVARAVRDHWQVENNLHWQLDVSFDEDNTRKKGNAARNFSLITKIVLAEIKKSTKKGSIKGKRKSAGWNEEYLLELLSDL
jgi:predicted transposase YbfD/YdcC